MPKSWVWTESLEHYTAFCPLIQVGERTSTSHLTWTDEPLPSNALVMMEIAGARHHYNAPLTRTMHLGKPPVEIEDLAKVIVEGVDAALEKSRPGVTCEEVEAVWQDDTPTTWSQKGQPCRVFDRSQLSAGLG